MTTLNFHQWFNTELVKCKVSKKEFCRYSGFAEKTVLNYCWFKSKPSKKNLNLLCITLAHFQKLNNEQNKGIAMDELRDKIFQKGKMSIENMEQQKENQTAKETSVYIAVRNGFGLVRRNSEIYKVFPIGTIELLCVDDSNNIWISAFRALKAQFGFKSKNALKPTKEPIEEEIQLKIQPKEEPKIKKQKPEPKFKPKRKAGRPKLKEKKKEKVNLELPSGYVSWKERREALFDKK